MSDQIQREQATSALMDCLENLGTGMLGIAGSGQHMQPMTHFVDRDTHSLWFVSHRDTDLVRAVGSGGQAHFTVSDHGDGIYACMSGTIRQSQDRDKLKQLWSPMIGAWFTEGMDDPAIALLHMPLAEASIWRSTAGPMKFGIEMARAIASQDKRPDVGEHAVVRFGIAA